MISTAFASRSTARPSRRLALIAATGAFAVAFSGLAVIPANAAANTVTVAVPAGSKVSYDLGTIPADAASVDVTFDTTAAARTDIKVLVGPEYTQRYYFTAPVGDGPERSYTVPVTSKSDGTIVVASSDANVKVEMTVVGYTKKVVPAPTTAPAPAPAPAPSPAPAPAPAPALAPAPTPAPTSGTPNGTNTGVPAGTVLKVVNGDVNVTTPGTVLNGLDIRGLVKINAANVTIKNSIIRGRADKPGVLINNLGGFSNLVLTDTEIFPTVMSNNNHGIYGYNFTATRLNIHNVIDGIHITGSNVTVQKSWIHDHAHYAKDPNHGGTPSHDDGIQVQIGNNIKIDGNRLTGSYSAAVQVTQDRGKVSNFSFTNNYADGGHCTVNIAQKTYGPLLGTVIKDNKFGRDTDNFNCGIVASTATTIDHARNFFTDGIAVTIRKGA
ncbi:UrcA family protein [Cryobacterium sp. Y62]|uniref:UrcA family protein n=1 Tax=Cryobacterium sp. Y62 TaxID=2048284 RepID=UPI0018EB8296|nr:UrcA family protein [Cryobacterium sp. Y62]